MVIGWRGKWVVSFKGGEDSLPGGRGNGSVGNYENWPSLEGLYHGEERGGRCCQSGALLCMCIGRQSCWGK